MQNIRFFFLFCCVSFLITTNAQTAVKEDSTYVNNLIEKSKAKFAEDPTQAFEMIKKADDVAVKIKYKKGEANALKTIGIFYYNQQKFPEALDYWERSVSVFEQINDEVGVANILNNVGAVYFSKGDDAKALEYCLRSLKIAEKTKDKTRIMSALVTIGSIYHNKKDPRAIEYNLKALPICEELGNKPYMALLLTNIGEIYLDKKEDVKAIEYFEKVIALEDNSSSAAFAFNGIGKSYLQKKNYRQALSNHTTALKIGEKIDDKTQQLRALWGIANVYIQQGDYSTALGFYNKAKALGEEVEHKVDLKDIYKEMALAYEKVADYPNAYLHNALYADVKDTLYNIETAQKLGNLQFEFDLYKKEGEITLLTKEKTFQQAELKRERQEKAAFAIGLFLIMFIAFGIYRNYRNKVKTNKILDGQKVEIENLLLNILPSEVAKELRTSGVATPRSYKKVSVLFSDFKGFTTIADKMTPEELVKELNSCFMEFDRITEKYNLEKIKTIGDAYMCAGGIPVPDEDHVYRILKASLEMQEYIINNNKKREELGLEVWDLRIGIHVGPVVAGVVGRKKYAYDIWGSTVNIASRMESNGAPGRVNISATTYEMIKDKYICSHRGKIYAKNVGDIDMYFVDYEIDEKNKLPIKKDISKEIEVK